MALVKIKNWKKPGEFLWLDDSDLEKDPRYVLWEEPKPEVKQPEEPKRRVPRKVQKGFTSENKTDF
jgi:hypothetical protein